MPHKISYEFDLQKIAVVNTKEGSIPVGVVEEYFDNNGKVRVTIKLHDQVPEELVKKIKEVPEGLSVVGRPANIRNVKFVNQPIFRKPHTEVDTRT